MVVGDQHHPPAAWPPGKTARTYCTGAGWGPRAGLTGAENLARIEIGSPDPPQPVANRYTDCAIAVHKLLSCSLGTWGRDNGPRAEMHNSWLLWYRKISNSSEPAAQTTLWFLEGSRNSATLQSTRAPSLRVYRLPNARPRARSAAAHSTIFRCSSWLVQQLVHVFYWCCDAAPTSASIWLRVRRLSFPFLIARFGLTLPERRGQ